MSCAYAFKYIPCINREYIARDLIQGGSRGGDLGSGSLLRFVRDGVLCGGLMDMTMNEKGSKGCVYMYLISIFFLAHFARLYLTFI